LLIEGLPSNVHTLYLKLARMRGADLVTEPPREDQDDQLHEFDVLVAKAHADDPHPEAKRAREVLVTLRPRPRRPTQTSRVILRSNVLVRTWPAARTRSMSPFEILRSRYTVPVVAIPPARRITVIPAANC